MAGSFLSRFHIPLFMSFSIFVRHQWNEEFETLLTNSSVLRDFLFIAILYNEITTSVVTISTVKQKLNVLEYIHKTVSITIPLDSWLCFKYNFIEELWGVESKTSIINLEVLYCVLTVFCSPEQISIFHYGMRKRRSQLIVTCTDRFTQYWKEYS